jgi:predicted N-acetyltransferase YhbS
LPGTDCNYGDILQNHKSPETPMNTHSFTITPELPVHFNEIDIVTQLIFGPGMYARAAYRLREGVLPEPDLSFVAIQNNAIVGTVRQTRITIGEHLALLLGPLGVLPTHKNLGIGKALMQAAISASHDVCGAGSAELILLVGDHAYYKPFGFKQVNSAEIIMPRPVDVGRVLARELNEGALARVKGTARRWQ